MRMRCIHCHCPLLPQLKERQQQVKREKVVWLSGTGVVERQKYIISAAPMRTKATMISSLVLGVTSPTTSGDLTILLPTSALLLFVYWIANFVVPEIIYKDLQLHNKTEDQRLNDDDHNNNPLKNEEG